METSQSPRTVMRQAWELASRLWPSFSNKFSRHDFTLAQLFACLVVREMLKLSYRKAEALLRDSPEWLADIGMKQVPDHNTLWRAFSVLLKTQRVNRMLDLTARLFKEHRVLGLSTKPLTIDSTCYETHHRSKHYDRVCRKMKLEEGAKYAQKRDKIVNRSRSRKARTMPKLALAASAACHAILSVRAHIGIGSDSPDFKPLLDRACKRAPVRCTVADAGFDSEPNHRHAREELAIRSIIPPKIGKPSDKPPAGRYRRLMRQRFNRKADKATYGQRSQSETINSMMKRNMGDSLRSIRPVRRKQELLLRSLTHNIMLLAKAKEG
jgi:hypothetical protein